ncbi:MAG: MBL fold metallo-hydrolase [Sphaerobacter sp.]|nr:MBL fold metallo-hydrolase [Sphaerobacter sp.]
MFIQAFPAGPIETNAFLVGDEASGQAIAIDAPGDVTADLIDAARAAGLTIGLIVLTHHHWDHVLDAPALKAATGAPIAAHPESAPLLASPAPPAMPIPVQVPAITPDRLLRDGDTVSVGRYTFRVLHTPGHAPGQISLYEPDAAVLFGGDTLFADGFGRVDLPGASVEQTVATMRRLLQLPDHVTVYPGHGQATTIGAERGWLTRLVDRR